MVLYRSLAVVNYILCLFDSRKSSQTTSSQPQVIRLCSHKVSKLIPPIVLQDCKGKLEVSNHHLLTLVNYQEIELPKLCIIYNFSISVDKNLKAVDQMKLLVPPGLLKVIVCFLDFIQAVVRNPQMISFICKNYSDIFSKKIFSI